jgi:hypothetical protein
MTVFTTPLGFHFVTGPSSHVPSARRLSDLPTSMYDKSPYRPWASSIISDRRSWNRRQWRRKWRFDPQLLKERLVRESKATKLSKLVPTPENRIGHRESTADTRCMGLCKLELDIKVVNSQPASLSCLTRAKSGTFTRVI